MQLCELKLVRHVCQQWKALSTLIIQRKSKITIKSLDQLCSNVFYNWVEQLNPEFINSVQFLDVTITQIENETLTNVWQVLGNNVHTLKITTSTMTIDQFVTILSLTPNLKTLKVDRLSLFDNLEDTNELYKLQCLQLNNLTTFHYTYYYLMTDIVFEQLTNIMPNVKHLDIFRWQETPHEPGDITWSKLIGFIRGHSKQLKSLGFHGWAVNQDSIADLTSLEDLKLEQLEIKVYYYNADNDEIFDRFVRKQSKLKNLSLYSWSTTNRNLEKICAELKDLESLSIEESHCLSDDGIQHIGKLKNLKHLCLGNPCVTYDAVTRTILSTENKTLHSLEFYACGSNETFINSIQNFRCLKVLDIENWETAITNENVRQISKNLGASLEILKIGNCNLVSSAGIYDESDGKNCISNLTRLNRLELTRSCRLEDTAFNEISRLKFLRHLNVSSSQIGDNGLETISRKCVYLESLDLSDCHSMSEIGLNAVFTKLLNFNLLRVKYNYGTLFTNAMKAVINSHLDKVIISTIFVGLIK